MVAYTDKQIRNGATGSGGEQNSAQPGPAPDVAGPKAQAESEGNARKGPAAVSFSTGAPGSASMSFEWDAKLAVNDVEGGGSG